MLLAGQLGDVQIVRQCKPVSRRQNPSPAALQSKRPIRHSRAQVTRR
jgi:hypothetical protein